MVILYIYSTCWHMKSILYERQHEATWSRAMSMPMLNDAWSGLHTNIGQIENKQIKRR
jgi:hypothetical protein